MRSIDQLMKLGAERHRAGGLAEARALYQEVLAADAGHAGALFQIGILELQEGRPQAALTLIERAIAAAPGETRYQFGLAGVLATLGRWNDAAEAYRRVIGADPQLAGAHFGLGSVLQADGKYADAIAAYHAAVQLRPLYPEAYNNLGNCHQHLGDLVRAEAAYRQSLELNPQYAAAMTNLGTALLARGRIEEAVAVLRAATELEPQSVLHAVNLGVALCKQRNFPEAAAVLGRAVQRDRNNARAAFNLGNALQGMGKLREAVGQYRKAASLQPNYADALNNLGNAHKALREFSLAAAAYASAIRAQPDFVVAMSNAGCLMRTLGRLQEAEAYLRRGMALNPNHPALCNNLGSVLKDAGELDEAIEYFRKALALDPGDAAAHSNIAYALSFQAEEPEPILEECRRWNACHAAPLQREIVAHRGARSSDRRIRVGYVSPDFRSHCQSQFTIPLLSNHDHTAFEVFCYSSVERADEVTRRIAGYADVWREVRPLGDAALSELIRADGIDILVDLTMHMANGRPLVFARKPAPVQIAWLAYPGTTGIAAMDFRLSDPRLDPPGYDAHYCERTIRLADSFWCYDPLATGPDVNGLPALERGFLTLGCLNNPCKLTDRTLEMWGGVMRALPNAHLLLMAAAGPRRQGLLQRLASLGIAGDRVRFVPYRPRGEYLRSYHDIDLGLDTIPYNGHTTSLDSFWMGVPVVTRVGKTCVGRAGLSQLFHLSLLDLAAESDEAFISIALALGNDLPRLAALRRQLRARLEQSPLMDGKRFARNIEQAYRQTLANEPSPSAKGFPPAGSGAGI
jgi:protein O-GlcNAc transferase